jgi:hypothetical protein
MRHGNSHTGVRCLAPALEEIKLCSSASRRVLAMQPLLHDDEKVFVKKGEANKNTKTQRSRGKKLKKFFYHFT